MKNFKEIAILVGLVALLLVLIGLGPLITIWSLNTLFMGGTIAYTLKTWFATLLLQGTIASLVRAGSK